MPHQIIEVSENIEEFIDLKILSQALHRCAVSQEALKIGGVRTRVSKSHLTIIADESSSYGFIAVYLRIAEGRSSDVIKKMGEELMQCLCETVDKQAGDVPLALSYEIQEIKVDMRWNRNRVPSFMSSEV